MEIEPSDVDADLYAERKALFINSLGGILHSLVVVTDSADNTSPPDRHPESVGEGIRREADAGNLPAVMAKDDRRYAVDEWRFRIGYMAITDAIVEDHSIAETIERYEDARDYTVPSYLPSDGSKGQAKAAARARASALRWLLTGED